MSTSHDNSEFTLMHSEDLFYIIQVIKLPNKNLRKRHSDVHLQGLLKGYFENAMRGEGEKFLMGF